MEVTRDTRQAAGEGAGRAEARPEDDARHAASDTRHVVGGDARRATRDMSHAEMSPRLSHDACRVSSPGGASRPMKPSGIPWLGDVPEEWGMVRNKAFMKLTSEKVGERQDEFPLLSLSKQGVIIRDVSEGKGKFPKDFATYLVVRPGNLVFCLFDVAETPRTVGLVKNIGMLSGAYTNFEIDTSLVLPEFAYYYYIAVDDFKRLEPYYTGLRKIVKTETFMGIKFPLPPLSEQREIAAMIDRRIATIDAVIAKRKAERERLDALKKSIICEAVTGRKEIR